MVSALDNFEPRAIGGRRAIPLARHATVSQGPGSLRLFESSSASGFCHELDGASRSCWGAALLEAKAYARGGPSKNDVCIFHGKTFDLVLARHQAGIAGPHWRVLASSGPCSPEVRKYCYLHGILLVDPELIPLPQLLRGANKPGADEVADPMLWGELVRLAERTVLPFEGRYEPNGDHLWFNARWWTQQDLADLLYVQTELTEQLFGYADEVDPAFFAERAATILTGVDAAAFLEVSPDAHDVVGAQNLSILRSRHS